MESPDFESLGFDWPFAEVFWDEPESDAGEELPLFNRGGPSSELELGFDGCAGAVCWLESDPDELGFVKRGGPSPEPELGCEGCDAGALLAGAAGLFAFGSRVNRGGASSVLIPAGAFSAFLAVTGGSVPFARHTPVPSQGIAAFGLLLCSALPTVNRPNELPERTPSYTTPESNAIGTGSALYALASQNFPFTRIATGMIEALPFFPS